VEKDNYSQLRGGCNASREPWPAPDPGSKSRAAKLGDGFVVRALGLERVGRAEIWDGRGITGRKSRDNRDEIEPTQRQVCGIFESYR